MMHYADERGSPMPAEARYSRAAKGLAWNSAAYKVFIILPAHLLSCSSHAKRICKPPLQAKCSICLQVAYRDHLSRRHCAAGGMPSQHALRSAARAKAFYGSCALAHLQTLPTETI